MSGLFKSIGKVFKKVVRVVKKIALPALAIAAVVVTGGAALGLLPGIAGLGGLAASLGASPLIAGVLSAAGTGATIGAIGGLITTGSLKGAIKGASTGFLAGAVTGGIGAAFGGGVTGTAATAANAANTGVSSVTGAIPDVAAQFGADVPAITGIGQAASGIGGAVGQAATSLGSVAAPAATTAASAAGGGGGVLGFLNRNPLIASGVLKGIGGALQGDPTMNAMKRRQKNYEVTGVFQPYGGIGGAVDGQDPAERYDQVVYGGGQYEYDPKSGRVLPKTGS